MTVLPVVESWDAFDPSSVDETAMRPGVDALCRHLGVGTRTLSRFPAGSRPVYAAGDLVLKLYPQADGNAWSVEASVLSVVDGKLPVAAPRVHATGDWDGWSYLLMSRLPGAPLDVAWPDVPAQDRAVLAAQVGELLAALHRIPPPAIPGWYPDMPWPEFPRASARHASNPNVTSAWRRSGPIRSPASLTASGSRMRNLSCSIRRSCASTCSSSPVRGG